MPESAAQNDSYQERNVSYQTYPIPYPGATLSGCIRCGATYQPTATDDTGQAFFGSDDEPCPRAPDRGPHESVPAPPPGWSLRVS